MGFTLIELLVTTVVIGTLAAVLVPALTRLAPSGDPVRIASDVRSVKTAIDIFSQNVRPLMPGDIEDLLNHITTGDKSLDGAVYRVADLEKWKGPYLPQTGDATTVDDAGKIIFRSGGKASIHSALYRCPAASGGYGTSAVADAGADQPCTIYTGDPLLSVIESYVAIKISGIPAATEGVLGSEFLALNDVIDGPDETDPAKFGLLRQNAFGVVFFLAAPFTAP